MAWSCFNGTSPVAPVVNEHVCVFGPVCVPPVVTCELLCEVGSGSGSEAAASHSPVYAACGLQYDVDTERLGSAWNVSTETVVERCMEPAEGEPAGATCGSFAGISPHRGSKLSWAQLSVSVLGVITGGIVLELLFHYLHHSCSHRRRMALFIDSLHHEFVVVGVLSLFVFMTFRSCRLLHEEELKELLEALHFILFVWILLFFCLCPVRARPALQARLGAQLGGVRQGACNVKARAHRLGVVFHLLPPRANQRVQGAVRHLDEAVGATGAPDTGRRGPVR